MKKCLLIVLSSFVCLFSYSANVPKVNNHGFPQNLKSSQKEIVIGNDSLSKTQLNNAIIEKGQTPQEKKVSIKKSQKKKIIDSKKVVNSNDKVSKNSQQKKEIKTQKRELKKELKDLIQEKNDDEDLASTLAVVGLCLVLVSYLVLWPLMFVGLTCSIIGLVLGIHSNDTKAVLFGVLGVLFFFAEVFLVLTMVA